jgi:hypothetical protein
LKDDRNQEVHDDDIPEELQQCIGHPSHELVPHLSISKQHSPPEDAKRHDDKGERPKSLTFEIRVIEKDHQEDAEGREYHGVAGEEEAGVVEDSSDHLDQEAGGVKDLE